MSGFRVPTHELRASIGTKSRRLPRPKRMWWQSGTLPHIVQIRSCIIWLLRGSRTINRSAIYEQIGIFSPPCLMRRKHDGVL